MATQGRTTGPPLVQELLDEPYRFGFFQAVRLLERSGGGIVAAPEDPDALAAAVRWLAEHPDEAAVMGRRGREFARTRLRSVQSARMEQVLCDAAERR